MTDPRSRDAGPDGREHRYAAVILLRLLPAWLGLDRSQRRDEAGAVDRIVAAYRADVAVDWYDADVLAAPHTDWVLCRFDSLDRYHALWEELRDTRMFAVPYAEITQVVLGLADGYRRFEAGEL